MVSDVVTVPGGLPVGLKVGSRTPADGTQRSSSASSRGLRDGGTRRAGCERGVLREEKNHMGRISFIGGSLRVEEKRPMPRRAGERRGEPRFVATARSASET